MKPRSLLLLFLAHTAVAKTKNDTLLWGPYRPNLYFGLRPQIPQSLMTGLMWFGTHDYQSVSRSSSHFTLNFFFSYPRFSGTRHACDQGDKLDSYTWTEYDPREGGVQLIKDSLNNVKITTLYLKVAGGDHGGSWAARIKGEPINPGI